MKVLVATNIPGVTEFCYVPEGEICYEQALICSAGPACGCERSISGTDTSRATTTVKVAEVELDHHDLFDLAAKVGRASGWGGDIVLAGLQSAVKVAEGFDVGTVLVIDFDYDKGERLYKPMSPEVVGA